MGSFFAKWKTHLILLPILVCILSILINYNAEKEEKKKCIGYTYA